MEQISLADERIIEKQLGRMPRGLLGIARRCRYGYPQVTVVYPLVEGEPFPTTYWLTCPFLSKEIDRLEAQRWVERATARAKSDKTFRNDLERAHRAYIAARLHLLTSEDRVCLRRTGMLRDLTEKGIGGIAAFAHVKCLHLHVAHALVDANPVGELVLQQLEARDCSPKNVICSAL